MSKEFEQDVAFKSVDIRGDGGDVVFLPSFLPSLGGGPIKLFEQDRSHAQHILKVAFGAQDKINARFPTLDMKLADFLPGIVAKATP